jgi:hypothetical protein
VRFLLAIALLLGSAQAAPRAVQATRPWRTNDVPPPVVPGLQSGSPFGGYWEYAGASSATLHTGDAGTSGAGTAVTSSTAGLVIAVISIGSGTGTPTVSSVAGAGSNWGTWTFVTRANARASGNDNVEIWRNTTTGAVNGVVTATFSASGLVAAASIRVFCFDSNASTTIGNTGTNSGATSAVSVTVNSVTENSVLVVGTTNYTNANAPTGWSANVANSWSHTMPTNGGAYGQALTSGQSAGNITVSATETSCTDWDAVAVEIKAP